MKTHESNRRHHWRQAENHPQTCIQRPFERNPENYKAFELMKAMKSEGFIDVDRFHGKNFSFTRVKSWIRLDPGPALKHNVSF